MRPTQFSADTVVALLRKQTVASLTDVMAAFGPRVSRRTAFRKLKDLHARTSYSHRGGYYTLDELADFDEHGLWTFAGVRFSRAGTLVATAEAFVNHAEAGHFVDELDNLLGVGTQDALRKLVGDGRLTRHKLAGHFLYCATDHAHQTHQRRARRLLMATPGLGRPLPDADLMPEELRAAIVLFASLLDERQRRLFAGLESLKCGWGGDRRIATHRPVHGRHRPPAARRARRRGRPGAARGRRTNTDGKKTPEVFARLEALMAHETAGDPVSGLKWTHRTTAKLAEQLHGLGIDVCPQTVARLLKAMGYSLRVNHKKLAGASNPNRDQQFRHITALRQRCAADHSPLISVDTKKKELVGRFRNPGAKWDRSPELVNDHDFRSDADGLAVPYGIYDPRANAGTVFVGRTVDTPAFAVDCIEKWWRTEGRKRYPEAKTLQILADGGGSNSCTARAWKFNLQHRLCNRHGLRVRVAHYPPATSKWNPIEHRLFCEISKNWAGRPLDSFETILKYLRTTRTSTGLRVRAHLVRKTYETGVKVTDAQMRELRITPNSAMPKWNYTIEPM